jgi:hypothetical protein
MPPRRNSRNSNNANAAGVPGGGPGGAAGEELGVPQATSIIAERRASVLAKLAAHPMSDADRKLTKDWLFVDTPEPIANTEPMSRKYNSSETQQLEKVRQLTKTVNVDAFPNSIALFGDSVETGTISLGLANEMCYIYVEFEFF